MHALPLIATILSDSSMSPEAKHCKCHPVLEIMASGVAPCSFRGRERQDGDILLTAGVKNGEPPTVLRNEALLAAAQDLLT